MGVELERAGYDWKTHANLCFFVQTGPSEVQYMREERLFEVALNTFKRVRQQVQGRRSALYGNSHTALLDPAAKQEDGFTRVSLDQSVATQSSDQLEPEGLESESDEGIITFSEEQEIKKLFFEEISQYFSEYESNATLVNTVLQSFFVSAVEIWKQTIITHRQHKIPSDNKLDDAEIK